MLLERRGGVCGGKYVKGAVRVVCVCACVCVTCVCSHRTEKRASARVQRLVRM